MSERPLDVQNGADAKKKMPDAQFVGNPDTWQLVGKYVDKEKQYMETTKKMETSNGYAVQVEIKMGTELAQALAFVPEYVGEMLNNHAAEWEVINAFHSEEHAITKETSAIAFIDEEIGGKILASGTLMRTRTIEKGRVSVGLLWMPGATITLPE